MKNGLPEDYRTKVCELLTEYRDLFGTKMGADPPAKVPPMVVTLKPGAVPVRVRVRRYSPPQALFLLSAAVCVRGARGLRAVLGLQFYFCAVHGVAVVTFCADWV